MYMSARCAPTDTPGEVWFLLAALEIAFADVCTRLAHKD